MPSIFRCTGFCPAR